MIKEIIKRVVKIILQILPIFTVQTDTNNKIIIMHIEYLSMSNIPFLYQLDIYKININIKDKNK
ncbi:MAG: hypothetical protein CO027_00440 [Candidatus Komeilibacteria bacterium CG_4_9_14_0_2_um_filter_36_13]|nr:MAG: hypothetical protein CO027_00440 [Candidatus Komeilibacteria bacterium CG_4_9_14_0_2_um_filter_36_13]